MSTPIASSDDGTHLSTPPTSPSSRRRFAWVAFVWLACSMLPSLSVASPPPSRDANSDSPPSALLDHREWARLHETLSTLSIQSIAEAVAEERARARSCRVRDDETTCRCLRLRTEHFEWHVGRWHVGSSRRRHARIEASSRTSDRTYHLETWKMDPSSSGSRIDRFAITHGDSVLHGSTGELGDSEVELGQVQWVESGFDGLASRACKSGVDWSTLPVHRGVTARYVTFDGEHWQMRRMRTDSMPPVALGDHDFVHSQPASGLLPPRLLYAESITEWQTSYIWGEPRLGPVATVAPGEWYGGGLQVASQGREASGNPTRRNRASMLEAQLYGTHDGRLAYDVFGDVRRGGRWIHGAASLEETNRESLWRLDRLREPGLFRDWRSSRLGVSLAGPRHHLQLRGRHLAPTSESPTSQNELVGTELRYGSDHRIAEGIEASTDLVHRDLVRSGGDDLHGTSLVGGLEARLGTPGAGHLEGALALHSGHAIEAVERNDETSAGWDANSIWQLAASIRGGVSLEGRFDAWRHRLEPRFALMREVAGLGGNMGHRSPLDPPFGRAPRWTAAVATLDQALVFEHLDIDLPIGIVHQTPGLASWLETSPRWFGRSRLDGGRWYAQASLTRSSGEKMAFSGGIGLEHRHVRAGYRIGTLASRALAYVYADEHAADLPRAMRRLEPSTTARIGPVAWRQSLQLRIRLAPVVARWEGWLDPEFQPGGSRLAMYRTFPELGWAIGLGGRIESRPTRWGGFVGFSPSF